MSEIHHMHIHTRQVHSDCVMKNSQAHEYRCSFHLRVFQGLLNQSERDIYGVGSRVEWTIQIQGLKQEKPKFSCLCRASMSPG